MRRFLVPYAGLSILILFVLAWIVKSHADAEKGRLLLPAAGFVIFVIGIVLGAVIRRAPLPKA